MHNGKRKWIEYMGFIIFSILPFAMIGNVCVSMDKKLFIFCSDCMHVIYEIGVDGKGQL